MKWLFGQTTVDNWVIVLAFLNTILAIVVAVA